MLNSPKLEQRIINLMKKGAKLVYHVRAGGEEYPDSIQKITLACNGKELTLARADQWARYGWTDEGDGYLGSAAHPAAECIRKHPDIRSAYAGYRGDFDRSWREVYEHNDMPVPRWIREQWATPVSQYEDNSW